MMHLRSTIDEMALASIEGDFGDFALRRAARHDRDERDTKHLREIGLGNRRAT